MESRSWTRAGRALGPAPVMSALIFASAGVSMETAFTGVCALVQQRDWSLTGHSYVWMFPIYGLVPFALGLAWRRLRAIALPLRLALYVLVLLAGELVYGWCLRHVLGACPWEPGYRRSPWAILGLTRLDYAPLWALAGFAFERLYAFLHVRRSSRRARVRRKNTHRWLPL